MFCNVLLSFADFCINTPLFKQNLNKTCFYLVIFCNLWYIFVWQKIFTTIGTIFLKNTCNSWSLSIILHTLSSGRDSR
jgi:hypothetical protein